MSTITHLNPPDQFSSPAFSQGTLVEGGGKTLYVGGQNGREKNGTLKEGLAAQTAQALRNVLGVLAAAGATQEHVAKLNIYLAQGVDPNEAYAASAEVWGRNVTAVTVLIVAALGAPGALVEIDAIAVLP